MTRCFFAGFGLAMVIMLGVKPSLQCSIFSGESDIVVSYPP
jgi:hypothetical protein